MAGYATSRRESFCRCAGERPAANQVGKRGKTLFALSRSHRSKGVKMNRPKVRHVAVMTKNREKMVEFYQKIFGLEPKRGFGGAIYMSDGDVNIALIEAKREDQKEG